LRAVHWNTAEPATVLIADADPRLRRLLRGMIETAGYTVLEAADGDQAWQMIQQRPPAVALLAIALPAWTGVELARALNVARHRTATRVVLFARQNADAEPEPALTGEAALSLAMPCTRAQLLGALREALAGRASVGRPGAC
jgi:CheY-like chemotaxis protein